MIYSRFYFKIKKSLSEQEDAQISKYNINLLIFILFKFV